MKQKKYIVMVSGGVDSIVLLDMLIQGKLPAYALAIASDMLVAHVNHGIRQDSQRDEELVRQVAGKYGLDVASVRLGLGSEVHEAEARKARYAWVESLRATYHAEIILTAHHEDDLLETMILQIMRGTHHRGLVPFERPGYQRPLLGFRKQALIDYANEHQLAWHEDSTNNSDDYLRNYVRHHVMPHLESHRVYFIKLYKAMKVIRHEITMLSNELLSDCLESQDTLKRALFVWLPYEVRKELIAAWLRLSGLTEFDTRLIERATLACAVAKPGSVIDLRHGYTLSVKKDTIEIKKVAQRLV
jgi:tRNA(Ile)-lysidine synthase